MKTCMERDGNTEKRARQGKKKRTLSIQRSEETGKEEAEEKRKTCTEREGNTGKERKKPEDKIDKVIIERKRKIKPAYTYCR